MSNIENNQINYLSTNHKISSNYDDDDDDDDCDDFKESHHKIQNIDDIVNSNQNVDLKSYKYCDSKLSDISNNLKKRKNSKINNMTEIFNENFEIETKETIIKENEVLKENYFCEEKLYLNFDINQNTNTNTNANRKEDITTEDIDQINDLMVRNNTGSCDNMTDEEKRQALVKSEEFDKRLSESSQQNRMRLAISLLLRIVLPLANGVASRIKNFRYDKIWKILGNLGKNKQTITNMLAYAANTISLGLSSVQVSHRIDPLIKIIKLKKAQIFERNSGRITSSLSSTTSTRETTTTQISWETERIIYNPGRHLSVPKIQTPELIETAEQCVSIKILCEPPEGESIRADIIFIHGLHGSLPNTWKQGLWSNERMPVDFERPPKPPLRPPKRPRYSRSNIFVPPHSNKKARWAEHLSENDLNYKNDKNDFEFMLDQDEKENIIFFNTTFSSTTTDDMLSQSKIESSSDSLNNNFNIYSTFRLRLDDYENPSPRPRSAKTRPKHAEPTAEDIFPFEQPYSRCWPGDWLPIDCPGVRVIAVNYTTDPHLWRPIWIKKHHRSSMTERVRVMTEHLIKLKVGHSHPIVWVGHSKGGLFIKQILVDAWESGKPAAAPLWQSSRGTFFYSVPHRGSTLADINIPLVRRSIELIEIEKNSKVLLDLHRRFVNLYYSGHLKIEVFSFVETAMTFMQVVYLRIVGVDSADPGIGDVCGLQLDHREICKPRSRNCLLYTELVKMINKVS